MPSWDGLLDKRPAAPLINREGASDGEKSEEEDTSKESPSAHGPGGLGEGIEPGKRVNTTCVDRGAAFFGSANKLDRL
jgi:hypothetical protein